MIRLYYSVMIILIKCVVKGCVGYVMRGCALIKCVVIGCITRGCVTKRKGALCLCVGWLPSINGKTLSKDPRSRNSNANKNSRYILSQGAFLSSDAIRCNAPREINGMKILLFNMPLQAAMSQGSPGSRLREVL